MNQYEIEATLIQRYLKDVKSEDLSIEEILSRPRWRRVWIYRLAMEMYEGATLSPLSMDEVKSIYGD